MVKGRWLDINILIRSRIYRIGLIIRLQKDGAPFPIGRYDIDGGNLTIDNIQKSDRGVYQCSATNEAATVIEYTELILANVEPLSPYNLTANSTDVAITLKWEPGNILIDFKLIGIPKG